MIYDVTVFCGNSYRDYLDGKRPGKHFSNIDQETMEMIVEVADLANDITVVCEPFLA